MRDYLVIETYMSRWKDRRVKFAGPFGTTRVVRAKNKQDAVRRAALQDEFSIDRTRKYLVFDMRMVGFFEAAMPIVRTDERELP